MLRMSSEWLMINAQYQEKLARALLPHATRLAGSPYARFFTRGLALSLLQRKPDEWRRQYATPSSSGRTNPSTSSPNKNDTRLKATAQSLVAVAPTNDNEHHDVDPAVDDVGTSSPAERGRGRKKRKRSAATVDEIDALFDDAIGRKVVRSAVPEPAPALQQSVTKKEDLTLKQGRRRGDQGVNRHADLGAVVDAIKIAPRLEGKKRSKRRVDRD
jgi:nucleolar protein 9